MVTSVPWQLTSSQLRADAEPSIRPPPSAAPVAERGDAEQRRADAEQHEADAEQRA
jgi:hypothetical protein